MTKLFVVAVMIFLSSPVTAHAQVPIRNGETFGNWIFECIALGESQTACGLSQTIVSGEGNDILAKITFGREEGTDNLILSTLLPLSLDLTQPIELQVDSGSIEIAIITCFPTGCLGRTLLTEEDTIYLAATSDLSISLKAFDQAEPTLIPASAEGLVAGMERANYLR